MCMFRIGLECNRNLTQVVHIYGYTATRVLCTEPRKRAHSLGDAPSQHHANQASQQLAQVQALHRAHPEVGTDMSGIEARIRQEVEQRLPSGENLNRDFDVVSPRQR